MKFFISFVLAGCVTLPCLAQTNSWTNPASGNWQDASWSLGVLPGTNQTIMLTNSGWKAVQITSTTAQSFPQSMSVGSVVIASPTNTFNTLLLNFTGSHTPFTVKTLAVASNSGMTLMSSALQINGPTGSGMTVGGRFEQNDSVVNGNQINVGYIGSGVYHLNSGLLGVTYLWVGGPYGGVCYQNGGTNLSGTTHLDGGEYVLSNGFFGGQIYFDNGTFLQQGGDVGSDVSIFHGSYFLNGGTLKGDVYVPGTDGFSSGSGEVWQTGGTNYGAIFVGSYGLGTYTMSNGVSATSTVTVDYNGTFNQWGGVLTNDSLNIIERQVDMSTYQFGSFVLNAGQASSSYVNVYGHYTQTGGTNLVGATLVTGGTHGAIVQSGGWLEAQEIEIAPSFIGGGFLTGGTMVAADQLLVEGNGLPGWQGFVMSGGQLMVSNIVLNPQGNFTFNGGVLSQSGIVVMAGGSSLHANAVMQSFGPLLIDESGSTNAFLFMTNGPSVVRFADSSEVSWKFGVGLVVENWSGSPEGGGQQQIIFGNNASALNEQQIGLIQFHNPAGLPPGMYSARILSTGEIVPAMGALSVRSGVEGLRITFQGQVGGNYDIEASTDLVHWECVASVMNTNGTFFIIDTNAPNFPARFYRTKLIP